MGYTRDFNGKLCCDACCASGGVRKRKCPHIVYDEYERGLPYCPAPALCKACWEKHGKNKIHAQCKEPAARQNALYRQHRQRLEVGDYKQTCGYGSWKEGVPQGMVGMVFRNLAGDTTARLVTKEEYEKMPRDAFLSDCPATAQIWDESQTTKHVALY